MPAPLIHIGKRRKFFTGTNLGVVVKMVQLAAGSGFGTSVEIPSTFVPFPRLAVQSTFLIEQFWGRAARASSTQTESGRLSYFGSSCQLSVAGCQ
jgi:hypothetical protein